MSTTTTNVIGVPGANSGPALEVPQPADSWMASPPPEGALRADQIEAATAIVRVLEDEDRTILTKACGTGKTRTPRLARPDSRVVLLLNETLLHACAQAGTQPWSGQLQHLTALAEGTGLRVRIVPLCSSQRILVDRVGLRLGRRRTVTVTPSGAETFYEDLADDRLTAQGRVALGHRASLDLLRWAAAGMLESPW
ncbi:Scr1 family TA system antitoxin-like transcriptional regulator [Streptomyces sp. CBMA156]|uniref:Scr1 family TA system antitoxin-like transcriptional regulator n=1 Tax=Streptomyces sp. CBMA156 TaxID=1930280 RepID=UPI0016619E98|nr:Scr1 family TA system antitoxin-like transcriptional regulator [Streptomyces sp. CBMA156]MBD0672854.1 hypothetical protein [Streptomyces sp. CBMA156]MBD0675795.1 hypothetical protein [Streptomyces sp. CBMA156]